MIKLRKRKVDESITLHTERLEKNTYKLENVFKIYQKILLLVFFQKLKTILFTKLKKLFHVINLPDDAVKRKFAININFNF